MRQNLLSYFIGAASLLLAASPQASENTAHPAPAAGELALGALLPLSGSAENVGKAVKAGVELALESWRSKDGKRALLLLQDSKSDPVEAARAARRLAVDQHARVILGLATPAELGAAAPVLLESKVPALSLAPGGGAGLAYLQPGASEQGRALARFAREELRSASAGLLLDASSEFGVRVARAFENEFVRLNGKIVARESYPPGSKDFAKILPKFKSVAADVLLFPGAGADAGKMVGQARLLGLAFPVLGTDEWEGKAYFEAAGKNAASNYFASVFAWDDAAAESFVQAFKRKYKEQEPTRWHWLGYQGALRALERAQGGSDAKALPMLVLGTQAARATLRWRAN